LERPGVRVVAVRSGRGPARPPAATASATLDRRSPGL